MNNNNNNRQVDMSRFKGIQDAPVYKTGQYFKPGKYKVRIKAVKWVTSAVGSKNYFVIETEVVQSDNTEVPVGGERSHVIDMASAMGKPNVKAFVACASGFDPGITDINDKVCEYWSRAIGESLDFESICELIISDANPLQGNVMDLECMEIETRQGTPFTKHNWMPYRETAA